MTPLEIALLGRFSVKSAGQLVTQFEADSARALLAYLVMHRGTPVRREKLAHLLWPEHPRTRALHALRQTLNRLRTAIRDRQADPPFLHITRQALCFNPASAYWLDVQAFQNLVDTCQQHRHRRLAVCRICLEQMEQAARLYRGDFLTGFTLNSLAFEEWLLIERERLHCQAVTILSYLSAYHERRQDYMLAHHYARRLTELDPWHEEAHCRLIRLLALTGRRSAALTQYETLRRMLLQEFAIEPLPRTQQLVAQIKSGDLDLEKVSARNVPAHLTLFVGRHTELMEIATSLNDPDCRLVTLVGPGGIGKTRLAIQAALAETGSFEDGVYFIPSSDFSTPFLAETLGINLRHDADSQTQICDFLESKEMLLVLDGFEHLLDQIPLVTGWLCRAPHIRILVTSRERLNVSGELVLEVKGLSHTSSLNRHTPKDCKSVSPSESDAMQLFITRARRIRSGFVMSSADITAVCHICELTQGMPLAIELAASWLHAFSPQEIVQEIRRDLDFLRSSNENVPARHRSLRAVFDASWTLLSEGERTVFQRLSIFKNGWDRKAAQAIAGADSTMLHQLINKSLIQQDHRQIKTSQARYTMHELIQRYATEKLAASPQELEDVQHRHTLHYITLLQQQERILTGPHWLQALAVIQVDFQNIGIAWHRAVATQQLEAIARATNSLFVFLDQQHWYDEGKEMFGQVVAACASRSRDEERALRRRATVRYAWFTLCTGQHKEGETLLKKSWVRARASRDPRETAFALNRMSVAAMRRGAYEKAQTYSGKSLALYRALDDPCGTATTLNLLAHAAYFLCQLGKAEKLFHKSWVLAQTNNLRTLAKLTHNLGNIYMCVGKYSQAQTFLEQALSLRQEAGDRQGQARTLVTLGLLFHQLGQNQSALSTNRRALVVAQDSMSQRMAWTNTGHALAALERLPEATQAYRQALDLATESQEQLGALEPLAGLARTALAQAALTQASIYVEEILAYLNQARVVNSTDCLRGIEEPMRLYLTCYCVLQARQDDRAMAVLQTAYQTLQRQAGKITDPVSRHLFLKNITVHHKIVETWTSYNQSAVSAQH